MVMDINREIEHYFLPPHNFIVPFTAGAFPIPSRGK
jgi:hypothetical protein